ncbi:hypothetical protein CS542_07270 [Pedobacter sp. IW39]|nr:hypothetical protein CS542_07270 [Pedobacter sp. IW39]
MQSTRFIKPYCLASYLFFLQSLASACFEIWKGKQRTKAAQDSFWLKQTTKRKGKFNLLF